MSPAGFASPNALAWGVLSSGNFNNGYSVFDDSLFSLRPVINLNTGLLATGTGTSSDPYVVQTN